MERRFSYANILFTLAPRASCSLPAVTIADVTALVNIILGKDNGSTPVYDHVAADVNADGAITIADVTALVNIILGK